MSPATTLSCPPQLAQHRYERWYLAHVSASIASLTAYLRLVRINGNKGPVRFSRVMEPWQQASTFPIMRAIEAVGGNSLGYTGPTCFWRDLPQGHDKTSSIARMLNGALAFSRRPLRIAVFARDRIQAGLIYDFMKDEAALNPWLNDRITFRADGEIRGFQGKGRVKLYASDHESNAGHKYDVCICEELTWWPEKGELLFDQLYSRRHKIDGAVFVVLGNAGVKRTWQHKRYERYRQDSHWDIYRTEGSVAGWITPEKLARDRLSIIPSMAARLYDNRWVDETEETYLYRVDLDACLARSARLGIHTLTKGKPGKKYIASIDYAPVKNFCAMAVCGFEDDYTEVVKLDVMAARDFGGRVPLARVREWAIKVREDFQAAFVVDPYQLEGLVQEFEGRWPIYRFQYRGGINNMKMAEHVRSLVVNQQLLWPVDAGIVQIEADTGELVPYRLDEEFNDLVTKTMEYGYRWDHRANRNDDRATAVGMAAYFATQIDLSAPFPVTGMIPRMEIRRDPMANLEVQVPRFNLYGDSR